METIRTLVEGLVGMFTARPLSSGAMAFIACLLMASPVWADKFVRQGATGNASGVDWNNACTGITGSCATSAFTRGETIWVAAGSYGSQVFDTAASGSLVLTIKAATPGAHGTGAGWSDTFAGTAVWGSGITFTTSNWVFDGASRTSETTGHGFKIDNSASTNTELITFGQFGVPISNVTIRYTALIGHGYCTGGTVNDRGFYSNSPGTTNITIQNSFEIGVFVHILTRQLDTMLIEHNFFADNNSTPGNHAEFWSDNATNNVTLRFNKIRNPEGSAVIFLGNGGLDPGPNATNTSHNWQIYGNIAYYQNYSACPGNNAGTAGIIYVANDASQHNWADGWLVFNNTFYDFSHGTSSGRIFIENGTGVTIPLVRNNIWDSCADGAADANVNSDFNYYRSTTHTAETNEQIGILNLLNSPATANFHLTAATVAGTTTAQPAGNTVDYDGVTRGADGVMDRGAFEFVSGGPIVNAPMAPRGLTVR